jgi:hypothetical protein
MVTFTCKEGWEIQAYLLGENVLAKTQKSRFYHYQNSMDIVVGISFLGWLAMTTNLEV